MSATTPTSATTGATVVDDAERLARVALSRLTEPGDPRLARLVATMGAVRLHAELLAERGPDGLASDVALRLGATRPERELARAARLGLRFVVPGDADWPVALDDLAHAQALQERGGVPLGLWVKGPLDLAALGSSVAVVGSRSATTYGTDMAGSLAAELALEGVAVVSGAAIGIDQAAHRGALAVDGVTVAVLACGADRVYPQAHADLLAELGEHHAVVSELPPGCAPMKMRFLSRNRIIAALAGATVVVEAATRSGALNTANWAQRMSRPVLGVPGPVTQAQSMGVHELIRSGGATVVSCAADVLELLSASGDRLAPVRRGPVRRSDQLSVRERQALDAVPVATPASGPSIARSCGIGLVEVQGVLHRLERLGLVSLEADGWLKTGDEDRVVERATAGG